MSPARIQSLRQVLWLYFWLVLGEGILRKWIFPGLSNVLLIVRDPVTLLAIYWGLPLLTRPPWRFWLQTLVIIATTTFVLAITVGHGDLITALFGSRILLFHLPLVFLYASVFTRQDVIDFAWFIVIVALAMTPLLVLQSNLPSNHILNVAPGGEDTAVFAGALDRFRPPGIFSFISGVSVFYTLAASSLFTLLYATQLSPVSQLFCVLVGIALVVALPVSISRSLLAGYLQVLMAVLASALLSRSRLMPLISTILALTVAVSIATTIPAFQDTSDAFISRWEQAAEVEGGDDARLGGGVGVFEKRVISYLTVPLANLELVPILGFGIGIGTNVGSQRLTGDRLFIVGEAPWQAILAEMGSLFGLLFILWRVCLALWILFLSLRMSVNGNQIPLILAGSSFLSLATAGLGQPTNLGFVVVSSGLTLAACNSIYISPDY